MHNGRKVPMAEAVFSLRPLYQLQLRTCAAIAELALRRTADLIDANLDAARQAIASNLEQCEALMTGNGTAGMQAFVPVDLTPSADTTSRWQRKWLDTAARTQVEMIQLLDQLVADWAALAGGTRRVAASTTTTCGDSNQVHQRALRLDPSILDRRIRRGPGHGRGAP